jgi:hypothetical protein
MPGPAIEAHTFHASRLNTWPPASYLDISLIVSYTINL